MAEPYSLASCAVKRALLKHPELHGTYAVWAMLEEGCDRWDPKFTNGKLSKTLGMTRKTVLRHLRLLRALGLVLPKQPRPDTGFDQIIVRRSFSDEMKGVLRALYEGRIKLTNWNPIQLTIDGVVVDYGAQIEQDAQSKLAQLATYPGTSMCQGSEHTCARGEGVEHTCARGAVGVFSLERIDVSPVEVSVYGLSKLAKTDFGTEVASYCISNTGITCSSDSESLVQSPKTTTSFGSFLNDLQTAEEAPQDASTRELLERIVRLTQERDDAQRRLDEYRKEARKVEIEDALAPAVDRICQLWKTTVGAKSVTKRMKHHVQARLREGHQEEEFNRIIRWVVTSEYHMGKNPRNTPYNSIKFLFGSEDRFHKYLEMARAARTSGHGGQSAASYRPADNTERKVLEL